MHLGVLEIASKRVVLACAGNIMLAKKVKFLQRKKFKRKTGIRKGAYIRTRSMIKGGDHLIEKWDIKFFVKIEDALHIGEGREMFMRRKEDSGDGPLYEVRMDGLSRAPRGLSRFVRTIRESKDVGLLFAESRAQRSSINSLLNSLKLG